MEEINFRIMMFFNKKIILLFLISMLWSCSNSYHIENALLNTENERVLLIAENYKDVKPITITDSVCKRSKGGKHDFYSEGDYWWPDPKNPNGPYIRKDGLTNPNNFNADRKAVIRLNQIAGSLASAYLVTDDKQYLMQLVPHLKAWFVNKETLMNPNLNYGQAINGIVFGRGIGIIDTVHFIEVAKAIEICEKANVLSKEDLFIIKEWYKQYLHWLTTSDFGKAERDNGNNHSVTWAVQVAAFAHLVQNENQLSFCRKFYRETLLPDQMGKDGSFPKELSRTKPYGYSIFVLDAMTTLCQILSTQNDNLFEYTTKEGQNIALGLRFLYPYLKDKSTWPYSKDVLHWEDWPVQQPCLLFGGLALQKQDYLNLWRLLPNNYTNAELVRNMPIKYPLLWISKS
jgi:hypothetical protein